MEAVQIGLLAMVSVGLWTVRVAVTSRGARRLAAVLAAVEALVYVTTFGRLLEDLTAIDRLGGFGVGVAAGTYLGMVADDRVRRGSAGRKPAVSGAQAPPHTVAATHKAPLDEVRPTVTSPGNAPAAGDVRGALQAPPSDAHGQN